MHDLLMRLSDCIGIIGVSLVLIAYFFLNTGRWISDSYHYQILNFIGAWLILFSLFFHWNLASVIIEVSWLMISLLGLYRLWVKKQANAGV